MKQELCRGIAAVGRDSGRCGFNHKHGALAKPEVRQALDLVIDKKSLVQAVRGPVWQALSARWGRFYSCMTIRPSICPARICSKMLLMFSSLSVW